ncbi:Mesoderm induction early response protein 1 [Cichlidogyrus casuarinus]|uniref:Mesoderm induction early response protein 1 n=1 Tax=Cichlidogyrus casuarinus TaxID=1844966 RepID=A0ABD2QNE2_9PLAT
MSANNPAGSVNLSSRRSRRETALAKKSDLDATKSLKIDSDESEDKEFDVSNIREAEEDSISSEDDVADADEIDSLKKEGEMSIEELMAKYGMKIPSEDEQVLTSKTRKRGSKQEQSEPNAGKRRKSEDPEETVTTNYDLELEDEQAESLPEDYFEEEEFSDECKTEKTTEKAHHSTANSRLWCKALASNESPVYNSEDDEDYDPTADYERFKKEEIKVGPDYQVHVSDLPQSTKTNTHEEDRVLHEYEQKYATASRMHLPEETDHEEALLLLLQSDYDVDEALKRLDKKLGKPNEMPTYLSTWSEAECIAFEKGFAIFGKNFRQIQESELRHRSVGELVHFYYFWKKTARYDEFSKAYRKDKKKPLHPGLTDFMDCLAHEQDMIAESLLSKATENQAIERLRATATASSGENSGYVSPKKESNSPLISDLGPSSEDLPQSPRQKHNADLLPESSPSQLATV